MLWTRYAFDSHFVLGDRNGVAIFNPHGLNVSPLLPPHASLRSGVVPRPANISQWYPEVLHFCPYTPLILVGLKSDLRTKQSCIDLLRTQGLTPVTTEQGRAVAQKMSAKYMECSSKEMNGVDEIFQVAIEVVVANDKANLAAQEEEKEMRRRNRSSKMGSGDMQGGPDGIPIVKKKKRSCKIL